MEHVVDIEHHLGEHPVVRNVKRGVDKACSGVGLNRQRQEVLRFRMDEEVGRASCAVPFRLYSSLVILFLVAV